MNPKGKFKPDSPIDQFFNNMLFVKRYEYQTPLPPDIALERLHELSDEMHGWLSRRPRYKVESQFVMDHHEFDIRVKDNSQSYTVVHASGFIHTHDYNQTTIAGEIRFGVVYFFLLILSILWMFFVFQFFNLQLSSWMLGLLMIAPSFTFVHMFYRRNQLMKKIQSAITPRMSDRTFDKPKRRKGLHEIYAELEETYGNFVIQESEQSHHDQQ